MVWLTDNLAVGGECRPDSDVLETVANGITHVLDLRAEVDDTQRWVTLAPQVVYLRAPAEDDGEEKPVEWFAKGIQFIDNAIALGGKVLVHCAEGLCRAPSMAYAWLLWTGMPWNEAWDLIKDKRDVGVRYADDAEWAVSELVGQLKTVEARKESLLAKAKEEDLLW